MFGWTVAADRYLSHSVLRLPDGGLQCVTPDHTDKLDPNGRFPFVEDADVTCNGQRMFWRGDWLHPFNPIVRRDPEAMQARCKVIAERIRDGAISYEEALATE